MHKTVQNLINIQNLIKSKQSVLKNNKIIPRIIAVSKTFKLNHISPLIEYGHIDYGENKVQEAVEKWSEIKSKVPFRQLPMLVVDQKHEICQSIAILTFIEKKSRLIDLLLL